MLAGMRRYLVLIFMLFAAPLFAAHTIQAVVFDHGGVVVQLRPELGVNFIMETFGVSKLQAVTIIQKAMSISHTKGSEEQFWQDMAHDLGKTLPPDWDERLLNAKLACICCIEGTTAIVQDLQCQGFRTPLFSNVNKQWADVLRKKGLYDLFDPLVLSYQIGVEKPDPKAYEILLEKIHLPPSAVIFIDDREENVLAARKMGIDAIVFHHAQQLKEELAQRDISLQCP